MRGVDCDELGEMEGWWEGGEVKLDLYHELVSFVCLCVFPCPVCRGLSRAGREDEEWGRPT